MKFVVITMPAKAHLNPILGIVRELVKLGHQVIVYNSPEFADEIKDAGAIFRSPLKKLPSFQAEIGKDALNLAGFLLDSAEQLIQPLLADVATQHPDCIIHDSLNLWGKLVAKKIGVPSLCLVPTMAFSLRLIFSSISYLYSDFWQVLSQPKKLIQVNKKYRSLYVQFNFQPPFISDLFTNHENLNLVFTSREFQPGGKNFGSDYKFVGPIIYDRKQRSEKLVDTDHPIVLISLGTIYNQQLDFYKNWLRFFQNTNYQVYMSIGKNIDKKQLGEIPDNIYVSDYLPQLEILSKAALFITHGGMNSINESLFYGVPMLLFPQIHEQKINAARVEALGAGIWHKSQKIDTFKMDRLVKNLITNHTYKNQANKIGISLHQAGGIKEAISSILEFVGK